MPSLVSPVSGLFNIDKPQGVTSHGVVARIRKLTGQRKVGHAGTLDPMATGVLLVCLGQATRLTEYLMAGRKGYRATIRFGLATDTLDAEGSVIARSDPSGLTAGQLQALLPAFVGEIEQVPPVFSAIKQGGKPIYRRARAGQEVTVAPRRVTLYTLAWVNWNPPDLVLDITCSPGTYIRSLARDLGQAAGLPAYLAGLARTASGGWSLDEAVALERLEADPAAWRSYLYPPERAVTHLPHVTLDEARVTQVQYGQQIELDPTPLSLPDSTSDLVAYAPGGELLAILTQTQPGDTLWQPKKVFLSDS